MNKSFIIVLVLLIISWILIIGHLIYSLVVKFTKKKSEPRMGNCPKDYLEYGLNNTMCCKGNISEWSDKDQAYMKCDATSSENVCKIAPNSENYNMPYCYSNQNICDDLTQVWNVLTPEQRTAQRASFEDKNRINNCNIDFNKL